MLKAKDLTLLEDVEGDAPHWVDEDGNLYVGSIGQSVTDFLKEYNAPTAEIPPLPTILPAVTLWERLTEDEADQVNEAMATQPVRTQRMFTTANTFRSDHELWPLLEHMATELFGAERARSLLAV